MSVIKPNALLQLAHAYIDAQGGVPEKALRLSWRDTLRPESHPPSLRELLLALESLSLMMFSRGAVFLGFALEPDAVGSPCAMACGRQCFAGEVSLHQVGVCPRLKLGDVWIPVPEAECDTLECQTQPALAQSHVPGACAGVRLSPRMLADVAALRTTDPGVPDEVCQAMFAQIWEQGTPSHFSLARGDAVPPTSQQRIAVARRNNATVLTRTRLWNGKMKVPPHWRTSTKAARPQLVELSDASSDEDTGGPQHLPVDLREAPEVEEEDDQYPPDEEKHSLQAGDQVSCAEAPVEVVVVPSYHTAAGLWHNIDTPGMHTKRLALQPTVQPFCLSHLTAWRETTVYKRKCQVVSTEGSQFHLLTADASATKLAVAPLNDPLVRYAGLGPMGHLAGHAVLRTERLGREKFTYQVLGGADSKYAQSECCATHVKGDAQTPAQKETGFFARLTVAPDHPLPT